MPVLRVRLFGNLEIHCGTDPLNLRAGKVQELLSYLLLTRSRVHPREKLAGLLWGECTVAQSRKYLRQAIWQLQGALKPGGLSGTILQAGPDFVGMAPSRDLWLDVTTFESACASAPSADGARLDSDQVSRLSQSVELYRGDLLEGWYQDWCLVERQRLQDLYLASLDKLMCHCEAHGLYRDAIVYGERILRVDRTRERTHQQMLRLIYLSGDRAGALRQYERCATLLAEDLRVRPARRTTELYEQIRADRLDAREEVSSSGQLLTMKQQRPVATRDPGPPEWIEKARRLQQLLAEFQRRLELEIASFEDSNPADGPVPLQRNALNGPR